MLILKVGTIEAKNNGVVYSIVGMYGIRYIFSQSIATPERGCPRGKIHSFTIGLRFPRINVGGSIYNRTMNENTYIASDIYDRLDANKRGESGSVEEDLMEIMENGNFSDWEEYFGDTDPFEFL